MPLLNTADDVRVGSRQASAVYRGSTEVWSGIPPALKNDAVLWLDAKYSVAAEQVAVNQGSGGTALDAKYDSTTGADTNDPLLLTHTGENYVQFPSASTDRLDTDVHAAFDFTGDFSMCARLQMSAGIFGRIGGNVGVSGGGVGFEVSSTGLLIVEWEGSSASSTVTLAAAGVDRSAYFWVGCSMDRDNGASAFTARFWYSSSTTNDPASVVWTQLGADVVGGAVATITTSVRKFTVGSRVGSTRTWVGKLTNFWLTDGIGANTAPCQGTSVFRIDPANITSSSATTFTATSGQTVTVSRATTGRKTALVTRPIWLFGTDDYLEVADNALLDFGATDDMSVMVVGRYWATPGGANRWISKRVSTGWVMAQTSTFVNLQLNDGAWGGSLNLSTPHGPLHTMIGVRDTVANTAIVTSDGTATSGGADMGVLSNATPMRVGAEGGGTGTPFLDGEVVAVAVWRRVLTTDEIAAVNDYYGTA